MHDDHLSQMFDTYDRGGMSRRQLIACIAGFATAAAAGTPAMATAMQDADTPPPSGERPGTGEGALSPTFQALDVNHIALRVTDIGRSRDWYMKHLGLEVSSQSRSSCFLRCSDSNFLALFRAEEGGMHHYCFGVEDYTADDAARRLQAAGLEVRRSGNRVYFDDPDGIEVQVAAADHGV